MRADGFGEVRSFVQAGEYLSALECAASKMTGSERTQAMAYVLDVVRHGFEVEGEPGLFVHNAPRGGWDGESYATYNGQRLERFELYGLKREQELYLGKRHIKGLSLVSQDWSCRKEVEAQISYEHVVLVGKYRYDVKPSF